MSDLADYLRYQSAEDVRRMDAATRIRVALELGDADLARYCEMHGVDRDQARRLLMRQRQAGRRPSVVAEP